LPVGVQINLSGFTPLGWNGTWTVASVPSTTQVTVNLGSNPGDITGFGVPTDNIPTNTAGGTANPVATGPVDSAKAYVLNGLSAPIANGGDLIAPIFGTPPLNTLGDEAYVPATPPPTGVRNVVLTVPSTIAIPTQPYNDAATSPIYDPTGGNGQLDGSASGGVPTGNRPSYPNSNLTLSRNAVYRVIPFRVYVDNPGSFYTPNLGSTFGTTDQIEVEISLEDPNMLRTSGSNDERRYHVAKKGNYLGSGAIPAGMKPQVKNTRYEQNTINLTTDLPINVIGDEATGTAIGEELYNTRRRLGGDGVDYLSTIYRWNGLSWVPADYKNAPTTAPVAGGTQILRFPHPPETTGNDRNGNGVIDTAGNPQCDTITTTTTRCFQWLAVLAVRDTANEEQERFRIRLNNPNTTVTGAKLKNTIPIIPVGDTTSFGNSWNYRWAIIDNDDAPSYFTATPTPTPTQPQPQPQHHQPQPQLQLEAFYSRKGSSSRLAMDCHSQ
jgi:hypothetical protein